MKANVMSLAEPGRTLMKRRGGGREKGGEERGGEEETDFRAELTKRIFLLYRILVLQIYSNYYCFVSLFFLF